MSLEDEDPVAVAVSEVLLFADEIPGETKSDDLVALCERVAAHLRAKGLAVSICPFCGARAVTPWDEVAHMDAHHADVVHKRLVAAGITPPLPR